MASVAEPVAGTPSPRLGGLMFIAVATVVSAIAVYTAVALDVGASRTVALLPIAIAVGLAFATLALLNFEAFILVVLASRTGLDALKVNAGTALADPAAAMGLLLLGAVPLWLVLQHRSGAMRFRLTRTGTAVAAFTGAALLGVVVSPSPLSSGVEWSRMAAAAAMYFAVEQIALHQTSFRWRGLVAVFLALPVPVVFAATQLSTGSGLFEVPGFNRVTGSFTHSNPLAAFLAIVIIMAAAAVVALPGARRRWSLVVIAVAAPVLVLTYTRGAWIAAALGVLVVALVLRRATVAVALAAAIVLVALLVPSVGTRFNDVTDATAGSTARGEEGEGSLAWRLGYWEEALSVADVSPVVGVGLKQIADSLPEEKQPHNDYLRAYVELGVLGLLTFILMAIQFLLVGPRAASLLRRQLPDKDRDVGLALAAGFAGVAVAYVTMSLSANLMSQTVVLLYIMTLAGLASAVCVDAQQRKPAAAAEVAAR